MSRLLYGAPAPQNLGGAFPPPLGRGEIELQILKTLHVSRQPIYDGPTLLYHKWRIEVIGQINRAATAYAPGEVGGQPAQLRGIMPGRTDVAIRDRLLMPRRQLHFIIGNDYVLSCPADGFRLDSANGPFPYCADILANTGDNTLVFRFGVECCVNPCPSVVQPTAAVLSHRWTQSRTVDTDGFSTKTTRGHAIFDTAKLDALKRVPDDFWENFCLPLELGFRRDNVEVVAHEDGNQLIYCVIDRETPMALVAKGCMRIECTHTSSITRLGAQEGAEAGAERGAEIGGKFVPVVGSLAGGAIGFFTGGAKGLIPTQTHNITVRVWGNARQEKKNLETIGRRIITIVLTDVGFVDVIKKVAKFHISTTWDINGRWVQQNATFAAPPLANAIDAFKKKLGISADRFWPATLPFDGIFRQNGFDPDGDFLLDPTNRFVVNQVNLPCVSRGTWVGKVVAQLITNPCQKQPTPTFGPPAKAGLTTNELDPGGIPAGYPDGSQIPPTT